MSKRRKWFLVGACAMLAIVVLATRNREPSYQGKSLSDWLKPNARQKIDGPLAPETQEAIRQMGTNALPFLLKWVRYDTYDPSSRCIKKTLRSLMPASHYDDHDSYLAQFRWWLERDGLDTRAQAAAFAFQPLGDLAQPAIPELTATMNHSPYRGQSLHAIIALSYIGKADIPALSDALTNTNVLNRFCVAGIFGYSPALTTNSASVLPLLVRCLNDPEVGVRSSAAFSLGKLAEQDRSHATLVVPALTNCLSSTQRKFGSQRAQVIDALGAYGELAQEAAPLLLKETKAEDLTVPSGSPIPVRVAATNALLKISPDLLPQTP